MAEREQYEVFAVKYAHKADRMASQNLIFNDLHDAPMPLCIKPSTAAVIE